MARTEKWTKTCLAAGIEPGDAREQIAAMIDKTEKGSAEWTAVSLLLTWAWDHSCSGKIDLAAEHLKLAAAMVEQRGRVLGALRAAQAVEEALWPDELPLILSPSESATVALSTPAGRVGVISAMLSNGFGPQPEGVR
jgi:hypothetical protein